jgi:hypothetical protein
VSRTIQPVPSPAAGSELTAVSCTSAAACITVGSFVDNANTLIERWDGASWSVN